MPRGPKPIFLCSCGKTFISEIRASAHVLRSGHKIRQVQ